MKVDYGESPPSRTSPSSTSGTPRRRSPSAACHGARITCGCAGSTRSALRPSPCWSSEPGWRGCCSHRPISSGPTALAARSTRCFCAGERACDESRAQEGFALRDDANVLCPSRTPRTSDRVIESRRSHTREAPMNGRHAFGMALLVLGLAATGFLRAQATLPIAPGCKQLKYRFIGPPGNRVSAVVGVPGDPHTYYVGAASGGVWKTTDGGVHWTSIFDDQPAQSIGSLAMAPSDSNVVWAGTGEGFIRSNISLGNGIYKSTDAGKTWTLMGLEKTGRIAASSSTRGTRTSCSPPRSGPATGRSTNAASSARPTAARPGTETSSLTRTRAARTSRWIRRTRGSCSPACGRSRSTPGAARAAGRAAACSCRATAERRGSG